MIKTSVVVKAQPVCEQSVHSGSREEHQCKEYYGYDESESDRRRGDYRCDRRRGRAESS